MFIVQSEDLAAQSGLGLHAEEAVERASCDTAFCNAWGCVGLAWERCSQNHGCIQHGSQGLCPQPHSDRNLVFLLGLVAH